MNDLIVPPGGGPPDQRQLDIGTLMERALVPMRLADEWRQPIALTYKSEVASLVERDRDGALATLRRTTGRQARWQLNITAYSVREELPTRAKILHACQVVRRAITIEPACRQAQLMVGMMLDGCAIKAGDDTDGYISALTWMLRDCAPRPEERYGRQPPRWMPVPAIANAIRDVWSTRRVDYGRPIAIAEFLDLCAKHRRRLTQLRADLHRVALTHRALSEIVEATDDAYSPSDGDEWLD